MKDSGKPADKVIIANLLYHQVNIRKLKEFALNNIPENNPLRQIILSEKDLLDSTEFLVKIDVWLRLARLVYPFVSGVGKPNSGEAR